MIGHTIYEVTHWVERRVQLHPLSSGTVPRRFQETCFISAGILAQAMKAAKAVFPKSTCFYGKVFYRDGRPVRIGEEKTISGRRHSNALPTNERKL